MKDSAQRAAARGNRFPTSGLAVVPDTGIAGTGAAAGIAGADVMKPGARAVPVSGRPTLADPAGSTGIIDRFVEGFLVVDAAGEQTRPAPSEPAAV